MASGDVVNTAARVQAAAPADGILVDETTYRATARAIEYGEHAPVEAKGTFYRSVGATRYIREAEALLAASTTQRASRTR